MLTDIDTVVRTDILSDISFTDVVLFEQLIVEVQYLNIKIILFVILETDLCVVVLCNLHIHTKHAASG